jgi:hypothetical protein
MVETLRPCPFGCERKPTTDAATFPDGDFWFVECRECGMRGPLADNCDEAINAWNQRTDRDREALGRIRTELEDLVTHDEMGGTARYLLSVLRGETTPMRDFLADREGE